jgi:hypothetical protein
MTPHPSVTARAPKWPAAGPVRSSPTGTAANDSRSSIEETRDSTCLGICVWSTLSKAMPCALKPSAPANAQPARAGNGTARPSPSSGSAPSTPIRPASRSGRFRASRYIAALITSRPMARMLSTTPQPASLPCCLTRSGPRTCHGPTFTIPRKKNDSDIGSSHLTARYSRHPRAMSAIIRRPGPALAWPGAGLPAGSRAKSPAAMR